MSGLDLFGFQGHDVRAMLIDGKPWFVASDVCGVLGLANPRSSMALLDDDETRLHTVDTPGGPQSMTIVNQSGVFSLILRSRKPEAKAIKKWITDEVLPAIMATGTYSVAAIPQQRLPGARELAQMVIEAEDAKAALEAQVAELEPAAAAWNEVATAEGAYQVGDAAKMLCNAGIQTGRQRLFDYLGAIGWIYRGRGMDGRPKGPWHAHQDPVNDKFLVEVPAVRPARDEGGNIVGAKVAPAQIQITMKGIQKLHSLMGRERLALASHGPAITEGKS